MTPKTPNQTKSSVTSLLLAPITVLKYGAMYENSVNWPAPASAVTSTIAISTGLANAERQAASVSVGGRTFAGTVASTQTAAIAPSAAIAKNALCHPKASPSQAEIGMPTTEATDQPRKMKVIAPPRSAGGVIAPNAAAACGVKTAAPRTVRARAGRSAA